MMLDGVDLLFLPVRVAWMIRPQLGPNDVCAGLCPKLMQTDCCGPVYMH